MFNIDPLLIFPGVSIPKSSINFIEDCGHAKTVIHLKYGYVSNGSEISLTYVVSVPYHLVLRMWTGHSNTVDFSDYLKG